jgi:DNA uptake protein ComE-like DNA-binding protein
MLKLRRVVRDFFGFPRAHVNAFLIMLPLMAFALFSQPLYHWWQSTRVHRQEDYTLKLDSLVARWETLEQQPSLTRKLSIFHFDPNRIGRAEMDSLGFSVALARRITNYREKGGSFKVKKDLLKIYGMDSSLYAQLYAYIDLPVSRNDTYQKDKTTFSRTSKAPHFEKSVWKPFDLNLADTTQLKMIKGIGTKLSSRIIKYRDALGGFYDEAQLKDVYGLDTTVIMLICEKSFIAGEFEPRKLQINVLTEKELSTHPYISGSAARAIVAYRFQHGDLNNVDDLRKIQVLKSETIHKITPYLEFGK